MVTGIVVVSYHNADGTTKYVNEQLVKLSDNYRIVVVAVGANERYGQRLAEDCGLDYISAPEQVVYHHKGWCISVNDNLGYAKGNNLGVEILKNSSIHFDYYLFSNDDIEILNPNILNVLASSMQVCEQYVGIGPRIIGLDGKDQNPHVKYISPIRLIAWKFFPFLRSTKQIIRLKKEEKACQIIAEVKKTQRKNVTIEQILRTASPLPPTGGKCYWVSGAFMMVRAERFNIVGGFDQRTFLYYEEAILAERFMCHGWGFTFEPSVSVIHYEGGSTDVKTSQRNAIEEESRMLYFREYRHVSKLMLNLYRIMKKINPNSPLN